MKGARADSSSWEDSGPYVCSKILHMFYQSVIASALFYAVVCWGTVIKAGDTKRLNKLIKKAGFVIGVEIVIVWGCYREKNNVQAVVYHKQYRTPPPWHACWNEKYIQQPIDPATVQQRTLQEVIVRPTGVRLYNSSIIHWGIINHSI